MRSRLSLRSPSRSISRAPSTCRRLERLASSCRQERYIADEVIEMAGPLAAVHESGFGTKRTYRAVCYSSAFGGKADISRRLADKRDFMRTRPSTTLADLLRPPLVANPFSTMRASLRRWSSEEFEDGVAYGGQSWLRRRPIDSFFPALLLRAGDAG